VVLPGRWQRWELGVPTELPLTYELKGAMVRSRFDLKRARFEGGRVNGVFLATQLTLPAPAAPVTLRLNGVFNMLRLNVPEGTPVRVRGTGFPFNAIKRRVVGNPELPGYEVSVDGIFNAVDISTRKLDPAETAPEAAVPPEAPPATALPAEAPPTPTPSATPEGSVRG
jgi:hypothetical protein